MIKFEIGKTYSTRSICDHNCVFSYTVVARTEKSITINKGGKTVRRGVKPDYDGSGEMCYPEGRYSMCPIIRAAK